jgi:hypothetical protein
MRQIYDAPRPRKTGAITPTLAKISAAMVIAACIAVWSNRGGVTRATQVSSATSRSLNDAPHTHARARDRLVLTPQHVAEALEHYNTDGSSLDEPSITELAVASMAVMKRSASDSDRATERASGREIAVVTEQDGAPPEMWPGESIPGSVRVLATGLGAAGGTLYAFRTNLDRVCGGLLGVATGCFEGFTADQPVNWTIGESSGTTVLFGFAPDRVEAIRAVVDGEAQAPVAVSDNAFFIEIPGRTPASVRALELLPPANGQLERIELALHPNHEDD